MAPAAAKGASRPHTGLARLIGVVVLMPAPSSMAASHATPETLENIVRHARPGETIVLAAGDYRGLRLGKCHFDHPVTLDASRATFHGLQIAECDGVVLRGGEFHLPAPVVNPTTGAKALGMALRVDYSRHVVVRNARFVGPGHPDTGGGPVYGEGYGIGVYGGEGFVLEDSSLSGFEATVVFNRAENFRVSRVTLTAMLSDGVDIAESHHGVIEYVECRDTVIRDKEHPDCIQGWSQRTSPPTSDLVIRHNSVVGNTQGISFFNNNGGPGHPDAGGFDRIIIEDNDVAISYPAAITLDDGRDSVVRRNHIRTLPGARNRASLRTTGAKACENVVEPGGGNPGVTDGKC